MKYLNRERKEISLARWAMLLEDESYVIVERTPVGDYLVSTVWIGLDQINKPPLIFETAVFTSKGLLADEDIPVERYSTEKKALAGHKRIVKKLSK